MVWEDVLLGREASADELRQALSEVLAILPHQVAVTSDVTAMTGEQLAAARVIAEVRPRQGQYPQQISLYLRDAEVENTVSETRTTLEAMRRLCVLLESDCLVSDEDSSPYSMWRVTPHGNIEAVKLDDDAYQRDEILVASTRPLSEKELHLAA